MIASFLKTARHLLIVFSISQMVFSPLALGVESQNQLKKQLENYLIESKLSQRVTYKEFWEMTKHLYPGQVYYDIEKYFMSYPNELMPEVSVKESLSSTGGKIPTLQISEKGKQYTVQVFGEKQKYAKFNNVILTENDLMLVTPALKRITASDIQLKKQKDLLIVDSRPKKVSEFPALSDKAWKTMSQKERAQYIILMRQTWSDSRRVLEVLNQSKTSSNAPASDTKKKTTSKLFNLFQLLESKSWANSASGRPKDGVKCIVAGYISEYRNGVCTHKLISKSYPEVESKNSKDLTAVARNYCASRSPNTIACNPYIYGTPRGIPLCVEPAQTQFFQGATHAKGPCDTGSPLGKPSDIAFLKNPNIQGPNRYDKSNLKEGVNLESIYKKQQEENLSLVEDFLNGFIQFEKGELVKGDKDQLFKPGSGIDFNKALSDESLSRILAIKEVFDLEIKNASESCRKDTKEKHEKNFWEACDQLQRRFLFVSDFLSKKPGCHDGKSVNPTTLKCDCATGPVNPGAKCEKVAVAAVVAVDEGQVTSEASIDCGKLFPGLGTVQSHDDQACLCDDGREPSGEPAKCGSGFSLKPWMIGAGVLAIAGFLWWKNKKDKNNPAQAAVVPPVNPPPQGCQKVCAAIYTLNPVTCSCDPIIIQPVCNAPKDPVTCQCPATNACTPGQQIYNQSTCQCDNVAQPLICPDGQTTYTTPPGPSSCPAPTICQNGSQVYPPATCPPVNEGGSGNSCPSGNCSGGVPTAN